MPVRYRSHLRLRKTGHRVGIASLLREARRRRGKNRRPAAFSIFIAPASISTNVSIRRRVFYLRPLLFARHALELAWFAPVALFKRSRDFRRVSNAERSSEGLSLNPIRLRPCFARKSAGAPHPNYQSRRQSAARFPPGSSSDELPIFGKWRAVARGSSAFEFGSGHSTHSLRRASAGRPIEDSSDG